MNLILVALSISTLNVVVGAPAVSSVHVRFVSGNKATQYSHGSGGDGKYIQYNLLDKFNGEHTVKRRSVTRRPPLDPGGLRRTRIPTTTGTTTTTPTTNYEPSTTTLSPTVSTILYPTTTPTPTDMTDTNNNDPGTPIATGRTLVLTTKKGLGKKRIRFIMGGGHLSSVAGDSTKPLKSASSSSADKSSILLTGHRLDSELQGTVDDTLKPKDTKAVKRSPFLGSDNFVGSFNFPDFDDFGGNDFGNFGGSGNHGAGTHRQSYTHKNPEALAPDGVFLPALPTEATHYVENDPYLADPETAKYAAQHPPFFSEFPHKRTVLALNERREDNGLEPNILRSIRPFFPFFEANNRREVLHGPIYPVKHTHSPNYFFTDLDPAVLYYAEQQFLPRVGIDPWSIFTHK